MVCHENIVGVILPLKLSLNGVLGQFKLYRRINKSHIQLYNLKVWVGVIIRWQIVISRCPNPNAWLFLVFNKMMVIKVVWILPEESIKQNSKKPRKNQHAVSFFKRRFLVWQVSWGLCKTENVLLFLRRDWKLCKMYTGEREKRGRSGMEPLFSWRIMIAYKQMDITGSK